jgi:peptidoglycan hydrolase-like protein with peptidoglycan-binding domain
MKRNLSFALAIALALSFSAFAWAQQPAATEHKQTAAPAKTEQKAMESKDKTAHLKLNKEEITTLQNTLHKDGFYKGTSNGIIDTPTKQAIRDYQKANKLKVTGEPNKETLDKLGVAYTMPHAKPAEPKKQSMEKKS